MAAVVWIYRARLARGGALAGAAVLVAVALSWAPRRPPIEIARPVEAPSAELRLLDAVGLRGAAPVPRIGLRPLPVDAADLDGDGDRDRLGYGVIEVSAPGDRTGARGFLFFGEVAPALSLGYDDDWGSSETIEHVELRDLAGTPELDLVVVLAASLSEVGGQGHRLVVVTFGSGAPLVALDHAVADPVWAGLGCYEVGNVVIDDREIVARTVVHDPLCAEPLCTSVRVERWTRQGLELVHETAIEPLQTADGAVVTQLDGAPPCVELPERRFRIVDDGGARWIDSARFDDVRYEDALRGQSAEGADRWTRWIEILP
jgi:hypothetical protein